MKVKRRKIRQEVKDFTMFLVITLEFYLIFNAILRVLWWKKT